ncbi:MAG: signal peptidase I, partial [Planctomycetota bacterium]
KKKPEPQGLWRGWIRPLLTVIIIVTTLRSSLLDWNDVPTGSMVPTVAVGDRIVVNKLSYAFNLPFNGPVVAIPFTQISFGNPLDFLPGFYWSSPENSDIVTFWKPGGFHELSYESLKDAGFRDDAARKQSTVTDGGIRMVKRIVAGPGDVIEMRQTVEKFDGREFHFSKMILNGEEATYTKVGPYELIETLDGISRQVQYVRNDPEEMRKRNGFLDPRLANFGPFTVPDGQYLMIGDNRDNSSDGRFFGGVDLKQITGKAKFVAVSFDGSYFNPNWSRFFHGFDQDLEPAAE